MLLQKYLTKVKELLKKLDDPKVQHVPREENVKADILSKLTRGNNKSLIQETLKAPSITKAVLTLAIEESPSLITLII